MRCLGTLSVQRLAPGLLALLVLEWSLLAWDPVDGEIWLLENVLLVAVVLAMAGSGAWAWLRDADFVQWTSCSARRAADIVKRGQSPK